MDKSIANNCDHYLNGETSDVVLSIGPLVIPAHKTILMKHSEYFNAMFSIEMLEHHLNKVKLEEELPFGQQMLFVLKIVYGFRVTNKDLLTIRFEELFDAIIIANKYQFKRIEQIISELFFDKLNQNSYEMLCVRNVYYSKKSDNKVMKDSQHSNGSNIQDVLDISKFFNLDYFSDLCQKYIEKKNTPKLDYYKHYYLFR
jgi:hypothetical protein